MHCHLEIVARPVDFQNLFYNYIMSFLMPPIIGTDSNTTRKVGFEIEYSGIEIDASADILNELLDGTIRQTSPFCFSINDTRYGTFRLEIDAAFLKNEKYVEYLNKIGINIEQVDARKSLEDLLMDVASTVVPCEIVMPPLPITEMDIADDIVAALREHRAKGTGASFLYAFGLHINAEVVSTHAKYILDHIRAFILLFDLICEETNVDLSRRISPYINKYPSAYIKKVLDKAYTPDLDHFIDDYLLHNPSRNHALDLLPLFAYIDEKKVMKKVKEPELVHARPTFHYRLANSRIDEPGWSISGEWNYWVKIEELANRHETLTDLCDRYLADLDATWPVWKSDWITTVRKTLKSNE